jgi:hypothetical protein
LVTFNYIQEHQKSAQEILVEKAKESVNKSERRRCCPKPPALFSRAGKAYGRRLQS